MKQRICLMFVATLFSMYCCAQYPQTAPTPVEKLNIEERRINKVIDAVNQNKRTEDFMNGSERPASSVYTVKVIPGKDEFSRHYCDSVFNTAEYYLSDAYKADNYYIHMIVKTGKFLGRRKGRWFVVNELMESVSRRSAKQ